MSKGLGCVPDSWRIRPIHLSHLTEVLDSYEDLLHTFWTADRHEMIVAPGPKDAVLTQCATLIYVDDVVSS